MLKSALLCIYRCIYTANVCKCIFTRIYSACTRIYNNLFFPASGLVPSKGLSFYERPMIFCIYLLSSLPSHNTPFQTIELANLTDLSMLVFTKFPKIMNPFKYQTLKLKIISQVFFKNILAQWRIQYFLGGGGGAATFP